jgi:hypothetical protein
VRVFDPSTPLHAGCQLVRTSSEDHRLISPHETAFTVTSFSDPLEVSIHFVGGERHAMRLQQWSDSKSFDFLLSSRTPLTPNAVVYQRYVEKDSTIKLNGIDAVEFPNYVVLLCPLQRLSMSSKGLAASNTRTCEGGPCCFSRSHDARQFPRHFQSC